MASHWDRQKVLELAYGFRAACVLAAGADLDLWSVLGADRLTAAELAQRLRADLRATTILLDALAALELLEKSEDQYRVPESLRTLLIRAEPDSRQTTGSPNHLVAGGSQSRDTAAPGEMDTKRMVTAQLDTTEPPILPMLQHLANVLRAWSQLAWVVRAGIPAPRQASIRGFEADRAAFLEGMHALSAPVADQLVAELGPPKFRHLLDVGGGTGTWTLAFLRAVPEAEATIFDLPDAKPLVEARLAQTPFANRIRFVGGDFYRDPLPAGADFAWVSAIAHQNSRQQNRELFSKVWEALEPGGQIGIRDLVMQPCRTRPLQGALFAVNMLVQTEGGGTYTFQEFADDLQSAGFHNPQWIIRREDMNSVILAEKHQG
ncbi:MAG: methyltransferase [Thermoguttaceae bacterium]|nr:methyltransferase [Thermoguttaceae bacterium]MDW8038156.1 methyltransferase [Thermoguttaceae bacterium]